ncbi:hypothetical protein LC613_39300 [Nostoc sphaeroides CHAB 2801]|uniref:hypothetical protein n=1 Tax=Nostoc sphaeroides TaxID=446679 RepID=UPI001E2B229B|nr:hypothetical protein [Nostoc sphaeroides]MCC5633511.1 hypothetical protein [Nostoc sphaeroides CHAB 2801]
MTDTPEYFPSRLDRLELGVLGLAERQSNTQQQLDLLTDNVNRVLARSAILDDVLLELRDSHEIHQRNFEEHQRNFQEHQRTTNAALQSLEAILLQLTRNHSLYAIA